jgi:hypothetical protein
MTSAKGADNFCLWMLAGSGRCSDSRICWGVPVAVVAATRNGRDVKGRRRVALAIGICAQVLRDWEGDCDAGRSSQEESVFECCV